MYNDMIKQLSPKHLKALEQLKGVKQSRVEILTELEKIKAKGEVVDRFSNYHIFLKHFIHEDMNDSFKQVAQNFIRRYAGKLGTLHTVKYLSESATECKPDELFKNRILNCMMTAALNGDNNIKNDFIQLYKKHYKSEYNQLKRFRVLSEKDTIVLAGINGNGIETSINVSRLLCMADFMNIEFTEAVDKLFIIAQRAVELGKQEKLSNKTYEKYTEQSEAIKDCYLEIREMESQALQESGEDTLPLYTFGVNAEFQNLVLNQYGYCDDYILDQFLASQSLDDAFSNTLHLMKQVGDGKQFTFPEVQQLAIIYTTTKAYCENMRQIAADIDMYLGLHEESEDIKEEPSIIKSPIQQEPTTQSLSSDDRKILENQIKKLQQELHQKEMKEKNTYALYKEQKQKALQAEAKLAVYEHDRAELISLREHVYQMTEDDAVQETSVSTDEMVQELKDANIAIIGGHINWVNKMKALFPNFKYIRTKETSAVSDAVMDNVSKAYFFTDTISHASYNRFVTIAIKREIPFGYIHGVNMEKTIRQMYEDFKNGK